MLVGNRKRVFWWKGLATSRLCQVGGKFRRLTFLTLYNVSTSCMKYCWHIAHSWPFRPRTRSQRERGGRGASAGSARFNAYIYMELASKAAARGAGGEWRTSGASSLAVLARLNWRSVYIVFISMLCIVFLTDLKKEDVINPEVYIYICIF